MSLTTRAFIAIFLMIGFYLLALSVAGGLLWIVYAQWAYLDRINGRLTIGCIIGAGVILWSIMPRRDRFEPPGPRINEGEQPQLFAELKSIAGAMGQEMPRDVFLMPDINAWVAQCGGVMGFGSHRVMALGLPLMALLTVSQFRAVLAHEFGHYHGGDTRLGPWIYKTRAAIGRTLTELGRRDSWLIVLFRWYGDLFLRITLAISRAQEYAADKLAAGLAGPKAMIEGLKQVHRGAMAWGSYLQTEVAPVVSAGFSPPLSSGFTRFLETPQVKAPVEDGLKKELAEGKADRMDSHPALPERIAALESLPNVESEDTRPATALLNNLQVADSSLWLTERQLKPIDWDRVLHEVWAPGWQRQANTQQDALRGYNAGNVAEALASGELRQKMKNPPGTWPTTEQRAQMAQAAVGCALCLTLLRAGWTFHMLPGDSFCEKDGKRLAPFDMVAKVGRREISAAQWLEMCSEAGIAGLPLVADAAASSSSAAG